jgi:predicted phosphate transport protein (TIGR00153 family)
LSKENIAILIVLLTEILIGTATGVQRTILSVSSQKSLGEISFLFPIISFGFFKASFDLMAGFYANKRGRKSSLTLGTVIYLFGSILIAVLPPPFNFLAGNMFIGAGEGLVFATSAIAIRDILGLERSSLSFGYIESACYFGYSIGAFAGGLVFNSVGLGESLLVIVVSAIFGLLAALNSHETQKYTEIEKKKYSMNIRTGETIKMLLRNPSTLAALIAAHMTKVADTVVWGVVPLYMVRRGMEVYQAGFAQSILLIVWSATMPFWSSLSDRVGRRVIATLGLMLDAFLLIALPSAQRFPEILLIVLVMGLSYAMFYPVLPSPIADLTPPAEREIAIGFYRMIRDSGYATGALLGTLFLSISPSSLEEVFINFGSILAITAAGFSIIFRETRPTWPFLDLTIKHVEVIRGILDYQHKMVEAAFRGDLSGVTEGIGKIKEMEREADKIKREIIWKIYSGVFPQSSRMDFERLVEEIDKVAGAIIECNERFLWIKFTDKIQVLKPVMLDMVDNTRELADKLIENLRMLSLSPLYAVRATMDIDVGERKVDELRIKAIYLIREMLDKGEIDLLSALNMMEIVNLLELTSDDFQDAADIIRIISYKHAAIPPERITIQ